MIDNDFDTGLKQHRQDSAKNRCLAVNLYLPVALHKRVEVVPPDAFAKIGHCAADEIQSDAHDTGRTELVKPALV